MSLTSREIEQVVTELQPLVGGFVQKIAVTEPRSVYLELRQPGASTLLLVCAEQGRTRLHVAQGRPASPEPPFAFQGLLRAELMGCALESITAAPNDRLVRLGFRGKDGTRTLAAELTGRHGNLFLLDDADVVRGAAVPNLSEKRDNRAGKPYVPPASGGAPTEERPPRFTGITDTSFPLSAQIEPAYAEREKREVATDRRRALEQALKGPLQKLERTITKVEGDVERAGKADLHRQRGELLKTSLGGIKRGQKEVTLVEYSETGVQEITIPLDPARSPKENLEREFHQYRRLLAGQTRARARLESLRGERDALRRRLEALAATSDEELLQQSPSGSPEHARVPVPRRERASGPKRPYREHLSPSGQRIRVGRGAKENDALTFRWSKGNDVWLHARGVGGAHVVIPLGRDEQLKDETLRDAALLAAHHSESRGDAVEVTWTRVKYVKRQKGGPGAVLYSQDKTLLVRPDPGRLARLTLVEPGGG
jgi:predicted ribosome quality control (RQC) complex YloA/Tae2 family protein